MSEFTYRSASKYQQPLASTEKHSTQLGQHKPNTEYRIPNTEYYKSILEYRQQ
ncbi:MAG: hypothetical protein RPR97_11040 [Colwellia sp.]